MAQFLQQDRCFTHAPAYDFAEAVRREAMLANEYVVDFDPPVFGKTKQAGQPVKLSASKAGIMREALELVQQTEVDTF